MALRRAGRQRSPLTIGLVLVVCYLAAIAIALPFGHRVLPMFEGYGGSSPYHWVKPPAAFAAGNVRPKPNDTDIPMASTGSQQSGAQSEDAQLILNLAPNAVPPHPPDSTLRVHIEPIDPATLGPVPREFRPNGNAYRVTFAYEPSGTPATTITATGNILLNLPLAIAGLLYSPDGRSWTNIGKQAVAGQPFVGGPFNAVGWYEGAARARPATSGGGSSGGTIIVVALVAVLALALGFFPLLRRRVRRR